MHDFIKSSVTLNWNRKPLYKNTEFHGFRGKLIQLDCIKLNDYFSNSYVGKTINEIQDLAKTSGFSLKYQDDSGKDLDEKVLSMDDVEKRDWIVSKARQYGGADKTAIVTISYKDEKEEDIESEEDTEKEKDIESEENTEKAEDAESKDYIENNDVITEDSDIEQNTDNKDNTPGDPSMPVMSGSNIDIATKKAKEYGLLQQFDDEDFGHGTKMRPLSTDNNGLMIDIIYSTETDEILCGNITTLNGLASPDEQKAFISGMAEVLCPSNDKAEIKEWVMENVGSKAETTVNDHVYETDLGPVGNCLYFAGNRNWEDWEFSHEE